MHGSITGRILWRVPTTTKKIYLTFDDGPDPELTPRFLDVLSRRQAKATFFALGSQVVEYPALAQQITREEHTLGSHGFDHIRLLFRSRQTLIKQLLDADRVISHAIHKSPQYFRPPHGLFGPKLVRQLWKSKKTMVLWNCNSKDYQDTNSPQKIINNVISKAQPGTIVLLHDGRPHGHRTLQILPQIIDILHDDGFQCKPLPDTLPTYNQKTI